MKNFLLKLWKDEEGAEFVEWVIIVALIAAAALVVYGQLETTLGNKLVPARIVWTRFCNSGCLSIGISLTGFEG